MSKLIPPLVSTTPPPIGFADVDDAEDDEFGDFTAAEDTTYGCDSFSIPNTPEDSPKKVTTFMTTPSIEHEMKDLEEIGKDHQDKRKNSHTMMNNSSTNGMKMPNVPNDMNLISDDFNGHIASEELSIRTVVHDSVQQNCKGEDLVDDEEERPPQLFDDDTEEKDEPSETPSNFSISFDDNVIDDDDDDEEAECNVEVIELPNHISEMEAFDAEIKEIEKMEEMHEVIVENNNTNIHIEKAAHNSEQQIKENQDVQDEAISKSPEIVSKTIEETTNETKENFDNEEDDFNAFASCEEEDISIDLKPNVEEITNIVKPDDDFDDFESFQCTSNTVVESSKDAFDDFADFSSASVEITSKHDTITTNVANITFDATTNPSQATQPIETSEFEEDGDDFGDFGDYTTTTTPSSFSSSNAHNVPLLDAANVYEQTQIILKVMFEPVPIENSAYDYSDATQSCDIFKQIKDVTETNALSYQWGKSQVQQGLLKSLNIDMRNILYAHGMPMPKFAANLGTAPLEPVKSDILMPTPVVAQAQTPSNSSSPPLTSSQSVVLNTGAIPPAQFDWSASGLANPLDSNQSSTLFDLEQLTATLSLPASTPSQVDSTHDNNKTALDEDWDLWLQSVSKEETKAQPSDQKFDDFNEPMPKVPTYDTESVNSLQFPEVTDTEDSFKPNEPDLASEDFSDFTSFQSIAHPQAVPSVETSSTAWTGNMIPLRETYIDNVKTWVDPSSTSRKSSLNDIKPPSQVEDSGWLQPTILTPVLSHKELPPQEDDTDDFADFQMCDSVPSQTKPTKAAVPIPKTGGNLLTPTVFQPELLQPVKVNPIPQEILWPDPGITDEELARFDMYAKKDGKYNSGTPIANSSSSSTVIVSETVSKPPETKLNGPGGSLMVEKSVVVPANKVILPFNEVLLPPNNQVVISKDLVLPILESSPRKYTPQRPQATIIQDEDDWSDFISTQPSAKIQSGSSTGMSPSRDRSCNNVTNATSTNELSLSIPQLRSIQPTKPPIPVITPRGLVQTKIPTMAPSTPVKSLQQTPLHAPLPTDGYQPAIISNQFAAQMNQSTFSGLLQHGLGQTTSIPTNALKLNGFHDDGDEWSDFMSSQPVNSDNHSLYNSTGAQAMMKTDWNRNGFASDLPNIITNPVHFQGYSSGINHAIHRKPTNGVLHSKKPQNLNVARLPDLDFVAPKTKVYNNKK